MDFGLGLVLSFTDNATGGMQNAINTLNSLTETASNASSSLSEMAQLGAFSVVANQLGSAMTSAGGRILSTFTEIISKVNQTGQTLMYAENQLNMLYRDSDKTGKQVLGDIANYAKQSLFEYEDLIPVVTMLKANGIEAFDSIASSTGNANQTLMDYAADLAAFNPQMRNAYGTGIKAAMGALNEYIAEGNARSLKSGASLDITGLLGEDKGATIEERSRQVADLMEKLNMVGISASLAESPMVKLGNISDTIFQFMGMISESSVYETFTRMVSKLGDFVGSIPDDELRELAEVIGSALSSLLRPIEWLEDRLIGLAGALKDLATENPQIVKFIIIAGALTGALLLVGGVALKFASSLGMLTIGLQTFGTSFSSVTTLLRSGALKMLGTLLPLTATIGLIYLAWRTDFGGIRTMLTDFVANIQGAFDTARKASNMGVKGMMNVVSQLESKNDFWSNFTIGLIKVKTAWDILKDAWSDYTISDELYEKMEALGLTPLISAILDFKWRFDHFKEGFIEGWTVISDFVKGVLNSMRSAFEGTIFDKLLDGATRFFQLLSNNDPETWRKVGKVVGEITAVLLPLISAMRMFNRVTSLGGILPRIFGGGRGGSGNGGSGNGGNNNPLGGGGILSNPMKVLKMIGSLSLIIGATVTLIEVLGMLSKNPYFNEFLESGAKTLTKLAGSMLSLGVVVGVLGLLVAGLDKVGVTPKSALTGIANIAILIGGLDVLITAIGALNTIPHFSEFISTGSSTLSTLAKTLGSVAKVALILGSISAIFSFIKLSPKEAALGIANLAILLGGLDVLVTAIGALNNIPYFSQFLADGVGVMSTLTSVLSSMFSLEVVGMIGLIAAFGLVPIQVVLLGLANLAVVLGGLTLLIEAFGALSHISGFNEFLASGGDTLALLFEQVGKIIGSVIGGVAEGVTNALPEIGNNLAEFGQNVQPFFNAVSGAPLDEIGNFASALGSFMLKLGVEEVLSFFTGGVDLPSLGKELSEFGESVVPFFNSVASISETGLEKAPRVIETISNIGGYGIKTGGLAQLFTGETNLTAIGEQLADFAPNGLVFFNTVANYSETGLEKAPKVFEGIAGIGKYSFKTGGLAQLFTGDTNLKEIGQQLADFAPNGLTFFNTVGNYSSSGLEKAPKVFEAISGIGDYDFKTGGLAQVFTGGTNLKKIGEQLTDFGNAAVGFFNTAANISDKGIYNGEKVVNAVAVLGDFKTGGLVSLFTGDIDIVSIGTQLSEFAGSVKTYFDTAAMISDRGLFNGQRIFTVLSAIGGSEFRSGGIVQLFTGEVSLSKIGSELSEFANNSRTFFDTAASIDPKGFSNGSRMFTSLNSVGNVVDIAVKSNGSLAKFGTELVSFADDMTEFTEKAGQLGDTSGIGTLTTALQTLADKFNSVQSGISSNATSIVDSLKDMSKTMNDTSKDFTTSLDTISSKQQTVYQGMVSNTDTTFKTIYSTINTQMQSAVSAVQTAVNTMKNAMNFSWSLPHLKVPHVNISGSFNLDPPTAPSFSVDWYAKGGVFDEPSVIGVGEQGKEAVMPLENNTGWISDLAYMLSAQIVAMQRDFTPVDSSQTFNEGSTSSDRYMTSNVTNDNRTTSSTNDNSVTFNEGAIQINCQNASEEEAMRMAKIIMEYIKRQKELDKMLAYG